MQRIESQCSGLYQRVIMTYETVCWFSAFQTESSTQYQLLASLSTPGHFSFCIIVFFI